MAAWYPCNSSTPSRKPVSRPGYWKYLPTGSDSTRDAIDSVPDFKKMNEAAIELADEDKRKEFVSRSIKKIEDTLLSLIRNN